MGSSNVESAVALGTVKNNSFSTIRPGSDIYESRVYQYSMPRHQMHHSESQAEISSNIYIRHGGQSAISP